jgi:hypothetical protein
MPQYPGFESSRTLPVGEKKRALPLQPSAGGQMDRCGSSTPHFFFSTLRISPVDKAWPSGTTYAADQEAFPSVPL